MVSAAAGRPGADCIAVAHHQDDQAETLLLSLLRGTGLRGLCGMLPRSSHVVRPFLCVSRQQILDYLRVRRQPYVTDSTNLQPVAQRNQLRLQVMPLLQAIHPDAVSHLCRACDNVRRSLPLYESGLHSAFAEAGITSRQFPLTHLSDRTLLHEWLAGRGFRAAQEEEMQSAAHTGAIWESRTHRVVRDRDALLLEAIDDDATPQPPRLQQQIVSAIGQTGPDIAYFDADLLQHPLLVRPVRKGDTFVPYGMNGQRLVSDYLTDHKVNRLDKARQMVLTCGDDIIWLIGHRSDNRYRVTSATRKILRVSVFRG